MFSAVVICVTAGLTTSLSQDTGIGWQVRQELGALTQLHERYKKRALDECEFWMLLDKEASKIVSKYPYYREIVEQAVRHITACMRPRNFCHIWPSPAHYPYCPADPAPLPLLEKAPAEKADIPRPHKEAHTLPTWHIPNAVRPLHAFHSSISPQELFKRVSPSVYVVEAIESQGGTISQGSAVAVSKSDAVTNCHVVARSTSITLLSGSIKVKALVSSADAETDRCYLIVFGGELVPIGGLRDYSDLAVGETVYTVGAPLGLDKTLGQGLISGLRQNKGLRLIQVSAPISRGSSGGGLFDDRGNLIGITTFAIRESQNLNFAIAASEYWRSTR